MFQPTTLEAHEARLLKRASRNRAIAKRLKPHVTHESYTNRATRRAAIKEASKDLDHLMGHGILHGSPRTASSKERGYMKIMSLVSKVTGS